MKRMTILLSAATLTLAPMMSSAGKNAITPEIEILPDQIECSCEDPGDPRLEDDVMVTPIECAARWTDVIAGLDDPAGPATYGASFEVDLLDDTSEGEEVDTLMAELEGDWSALCLEGVCDVPSTTFYLTNFDTGTDQIAVYAAVKAFYNGKGGSKPRNFEKTRSAVACYTNVPSE